MKRILGGLYILITSIMLVNGQDYASQSVLKSGEWYKIAVTETGMFKLDRSFLSGLGIAVDNIDPRNLALYGNGGQMLPQANAALRHDDLVENPISVIGEEDGSFDASDYVLFYGEGPHTWHYDELAQAFRHEFHHYSDTNFYFLRVGGEAGLRISSAPDAGNATFEAEVAMGTVFHERDIENPIQSGRVWLGERLSTNGTRRFSFYLPNAKANGNISLRLRVAGRSDRATFFNVSAGGEMVASGSVEHVNVGSAEREYYHSTQINGSVSTNKINGNDSLAIQIEYNGNNSSRSEGWLDWIEVSYDQELSLSNRTQWAGHLMPGTGTSDVARLRFSGANNSYQVWDVTDPVQAQRLSTSVNGSTLETRIAADRVRSVIAFRDAPLRPVAGRRVINQDLHGIPLVDYLVITHPNFWVDAQRLAAFHSSHYGRSTSVVTVEQIYNEFSSGKQDVSAIRDFIRMLYVRSGGLSPGFVCLFGDGSYIYKDISQASTNATNYVPTYQSRNSFFQVLSFTSDDFFVLLEEEEGYWGEASSYEGDGIREVNTLDVAIGRLPIEDTTQARQVVDKIIRYATDNNFGMWRNEVILLADHRDSDGIIHVDQADSYSPIIADRAPCVDIDKIYLDNYRMVVSGGNESFPEGREAALRAMDRGSLIFNYTGHGSENAWSYSRVFKNSDINNMQNAGRNPAVVTATCEYGRYDNPAKRSGAELMCMHPEVGAIAMFTTVRIVYAHANARLNTNFYNSVFTYDTLRQRMPTMGEVMAQTKNTTFPRSDINSRNFTLLGDPGLILNYPQERVRITEIDDRPVDGSTQDTLSSLSLVKVEGVVENALGEQLKTFDGDMEVTVYDKPSTFTTQRAPYTFTSQTNRIFNGRAAVTEGEFSFEFVVPIDISYEDGEGKISAYVYNETVDGAGCYNDLYVGGTNPDAELDTQGPDVDLFINDTNWRDGSITSQSPDLFALVFDENGINTTGTGIGHEITAVLDDNEEEVFILNDYYTADQGSYQRGTVRYPLRDIPVGKHTLRIRVWDVANNSSEDETTFIVADNINMALEQVLNYPNPFDPASSGDTRFFINHNMDGQPLRLEVEIFTLSGRVVRRLEEEFVAVGNIADQLTWDGTNGLGTPITAGMYLYRVRLTHTETGQMIEDAERLVLMRE